MGWHVWLHAEPQSQVMESSGRCFDPTCQNPAICTQKLLWPAGTAYQCAKTCQFLPYHTMSAKRGFLVLLLTCRHIPL